ncbi:hypothetical protein IOD40_18255 [Aquamicrobium sp. cd-1]|uniref:Uncharacterized protein n=2 Tax=Aquamicrobium zhengzhouense TaxID=2781738 RepID=A0ABS0SII0_9HYPH|nr:hypothetical protein [Aquamicrobium zhengzhouense]
MAIAGEDAMKKRLVEDGAEVLGGEFFLADDSLIYRTWAAGNNAGRAAQEQYISKTKPLTKAFV